MRNNIKVATWAKHENFSRKHNFMHWAKQICCQIFPHYCLPLHPLFRKLISFLDHRRTNVCFDSFQRHRSPSYWLWLCYAGKWKYYILFFFKCIIQTRLIFIVNCWHISSLKELDMDITASWMLVANSTLFPRRADTQNSIYKILSCLSVSKKVSVPL